MTNSQESKVLEFLTAQKYFAWSELELLVRFARPFYLFIPQSLKLSMDLRRLERAGFIESKVIKGIRYYQLSGKKTRLRYCTMAEGHYCQWSQ